MVQEIRLLANITLEVDAELSREELIKKFSGASVRVTGNGSQLWIQDSTLEIIDIEEEGQIF